MNNLLNAFLSFFVHDVVISLIEICNESFGVVLILSSLVWKVIRVDLRFFFLVDFFFNFITKHLIDGIEPHNLF